MSLFEEDLDQKIHDIFMNELKRGSGVSQGKKRIADLFNQKLTKSETIQILKNEYGVGGRSLLNGGWLDHDSKGIRISLDLFDEDQQRLYTWDRVYDALLNLIRAGRYIDEELEGDSSEKRT